MNKRLLPGRPRRARGDMTRYAIPEREPLAVMVAEAVLESAHPAATVSADPA